MTDKLSMLEPKSTTDGWYVGKNEKGKFFLVVAEKCQAVGPIAGIILTHALAGEALDPDTNASLVADIEVQTGRSFNRQSYHVYMHYARAAVEAISDNVYTVSKSQMGRYGSYADAKLTKADTETPPLPTSAGWLIHRQPNSSFFLIRGEKSISVHPVMAIILAHALGGEVLDPKTNQRLVTNIEEWLGTPFNPKSYKVNLTRARDAVESVSSNTYTILCGQNYRGGSYANVRLVPLPIAPAAG